MSMSTRIGCKSDDADIYAYVPLGDLHRVVQHLDAISEATGVALFSSLFANLEMHREQVEHQCWRDDRSDEENTRIVEDELKNRLPYIAPSCVLIVFRALYRSLQNPEPPLQTLLHKDGCAVRLESVLESLRRGISYLEKASEPVHLAVEC